jgi:hypothetical protein
MMHQALAYPWPGLAHLCRADTRGRLRCIRPLPLPATHLQRAEAHGQVVQPASKDELVPGTAQLPGLHVAHVELKVDNVGGRAAQLLRQHGQQQAVVLAGQV